METEARHEVVKQKQIKQKNPLKMKKPGQKKISNKAGQQKQTSRSLGPARSSRSKKPQNLKNSWIWNVSPVPKSRRFATIIKSDKIRQDT